MVTHAAPIPTSPSMSLRQWGMLVLLGTIWGGSYFFARIAVAEMAPLTLVLFRVTIAAAALLIWLAARGPSFDSAVPRWKGFFVLAVVNNVIPFSLIFAGQTQLGAGVASILNATTPFWTAILATFITADEKLTGRKMAGIFLGIAGTAVMIGPSLVHDFGGPLWAKLALVGAALSYACAFLVARRFSSLPPPVVATGQMTASTIVMIPIVFIVHGPGGLFASSFDVWLAVFALALLSTAFAYILFFRLVATVGATNASLVTLIVPASAIILGVAFLGESLGPYEIAGIVLIGCGLLTIDGRVLRILVFPDRRRADAE